MKSKKAQVTKNPSVKIINSGIVPGILAYDKERTQLAGALLSQENPMLCLKIQEYLKELTMKKYGLLFAFLLIENIEEKV
ncbi:MAG: hypothetical protein MZV64_38395 [Ignavibacteriales bacterium]|nr:hypothetical protein [Ignavibacteriales bacterium]